MPRARSTENIPQTVATPYEEQGSGCLSGFTVIPFTVIVISSVLASFAMKINPVIPNNASAPVMLPSTSMPVTVIPQAEIPIPTEVSPLTSVLSAIILTEPVYSSSISHTFTPQIQYWGEHITRWSADYGLDPNLAATVMQIESCGDPRATSTSGAMGLFQVMPFHFHASDEPYAPETNAQRGLAYLRKSLDTANGDARLALAGYNGGIGVISRPEWAWPAETKRYVLFGWPMYSATLTGGSNDAVQNWYVKYGASLCRQASARLGLAE